MLPGVRQKASRSPRSLIVDDQMQLEAVEPTHRGLAAARIHPEDAVLRDARILADTQARGVHEADARTGSQLRLDGDCQGNHDPGNERYKARVAQQVRKLRTQLGLDVVRVEAFEGAKARRLEQNQDGHDLAGTQPRGTLASTLSVSHLLLLPQGLEYLPESIHRTVQVEYTHAQCLQTGLTGCVENRIISRLKALCLSRTHVNHVQTRFTFWRSTIFMALVDVAIVVLTIGTLYQEAQTGGISILVLLSSVLLLIMIGIGQYRWWQNARRELFDYTAEDDNHLESE